MFGNSYARTFTLRCDGCGDPIHFEVTDPFPDGVVKLPEGWESVRVLGWAGDFHACSPPCIGKIRGRYERPER